MRRLLGTHRRSTEAVLTKLLVVAPVIALVLILSLTTAGCSGNDPQHEETDGITSSAEATAQAGTGEKVSIRVLFAGSLIIPFADLEREFEADNPDIDVDMEGHGSIQVIRHVSDLHESADVLVTADYTLIPMLLYQVDDPDTGKKYADWYAVFATNEMVLAYTSESAYASEVSGDNWFEIINRSDVRLGSADPRLDANGYRSLMMMKLAEDYYSASSLFTQTFGDKFRYPIRVSTASQGSLVKVPEVLETKSGSSLVVRPYSVQLMPLLESGEIDYSFEYRSVAEQHGMKYVTLPPELNLSDPAYAATYSTVTVKLDFQRFATVKPEFPGDAIRYGLTIPSNARRPEAAARFVAYLLGPRGQELMAQNHQPMIVPAEADNLGALPGAVRELCTPED